MIKSKLKNQKGISLLSLTITIIVLVIITNVLIYNAKDSVSIKVLKNMYNDVENLREKVSDYYSKYGTIPIVKDKEFIINEEDEIYKSGVISQATDTGKFYPINLKLLENLSLEYGTDYKKIDNISQENLKELGDMYIINEDSHNIFYVKGIVVDNVTYYTDYTSSEKENVKTTIRYIDGVKIPNNFYYVNGKRDTGIVISDKPGDDLSNSQKGNQFVWVPVQDSNLKVSENSIDDNEYKFVESVNANAGFWVGRFETGIENNTLVSKKGMNIYKSVKVLDAKAKVEDLYKDEKYNLTSGMVSYNAYKKILEFMGKENDKDFSSWGNFNSSETDPKVTGSLERYCINNIFDLAGNVSEYTTTLNSSNIQNIYYVGGSFKNAGTQIESTIDKDASPSADIGVRIILYANVEQGWSLKYEESATYTDTNGDSAYIPAGFQVSKREDMNKIRTGLVIKDEIGNEYVWIVVPKRLTMDLKSENEIEKALIDYCEYYNQDKYEDKWYDGCGLSQEQYTKLKKDMLLSIQEKGGFYIARYEAGIEAQKISGDVTESIESLKSSNGLPLSQQNKYVYNNITCSQAQGLAISLDEDENRYSLPFGLQFDLISKFIEETRTKTKSEIKTDSTAWGNYSNSAFKMLRGKYKTDVKESAYQEAIQKVATQKLLTTTGCTEKNSVINIYDIAGNVYEWTLENSLVLNTNIARSGAYTTDGKSSNMNSRTIIEKKLCNSDNGFRVVLY